MTGTSQAYNTGIAHLGRGGAGGMAFCGAKRAHITVSREQFKSGGWKQCKRCAAKLAASEAKATAKAAKIDAKIDNDIAKQIADGERACADVR